jgi:L-lactate dehydrogenase complex protein LldG
MTAREEILARIHAALPEEAKDIAGSHASIPRLYQRTGALDASAQLELFIDRLVDYDTEIIQVETESDLAAAIQQALQRVCRCNKRQRARFAEDSPVRKREGYRNFRGPL